MSTTDLITSINTLKSKLASEKRLYNFLLKQKGASEKTENLYKQIKMADDEIKQLQQLHDKLLFEKFVVGE